MPRLQCKSFSTAHQGRRFEHGRVELVQHPPHGSGLDLALKLTQDLCVESGSGQPMLASVGSISVRAAIERSQPVLSLHGHIHESRAIARIGRTVCVNPGSLYGEGVLRGVLSALEGDRVVEQQLVAG